MDSWGIIFATYIMGNGLVFLVYKELLEIKRTKTSNPTEEWARNVNMSDCQNTKSLITCSVEKLCGNGIVIHAGGGVNQYNANGKVW